jgi:hypothetical protein
MTKIRKKHGAAAQLEPIDLWRSDELWAIVPKNAIEVRINTGCNGEEADAKLAYITDISAAIEEVLAHR